MVATKAFRMFLGVPATVEEWDKDHTVCMLRFADNPLAEFVELPPGMGELQYSNLLCGAIVGALEMVQMRVACAFTEDMLHGAFRNSMRVELKELLEDQAGDEYKEG